MKEPPLPSKIPKYGNTAIFHIVLTRFGHMDEENWLCVERVWCFIASLQYAAKSQIKARSTN